MQRQAAGISGVYRVMGLLLCGLVTIFIQGTLLRLVLPAMIVPNLLLALVVFLAFTEQSVLGVVLAFFLGLQLDVYSGTLLGPWAGAFTLVFLGLYILSPRMFLDSPMVVVLSTIGACLMGSAVYLFVSTLAPTADHAAGGWGALLTYGPSEAVVTGLCAPLVFAVVRRLLRSRTSETRFK